MNKVPEFWERVEIANKTEEQLRRKLLTLEKPKAKTAFITTEAKADRKRAVSWWVDLGMEGERMEGDHRERLFLRVAPFSGSHSGSCTGTHARVEGSGGDPRSHTADAAGSSHCVPYGVVAKSKGAGTQQVWAELQLCGL